MRWPPKRSVPPALKDGNVLISFEECIEFELAREGAPPGKDGYVNDPKDPGGETKFGISKTAYPTLDIKALTREQAIAIYKRDYWIPLGAETIPAPVRLAAFDCAINCGVARAKAFSPAAAGLSVYLWRRIAFYRQIVQKRPKSLAFLPGWLRRLELVWEASQ
jgi:hypothetical protein